MHHAATVTEARDTTCPPANIRSDNQPGGEGARSYDVGMRLNRRGWHVLCSVASADGLYCVDVYGEGEHYGFASFRSDPEDVGAWTLLPGQGFSGFAEAHEAGKKALASVGWLHFDAAASAQLNTWIERQIQLK